MKPEIPDFQTLEEMVAWFEAQPRGKYDLLWGSDGAKLTTAAPEYKTVFEIKDERAAFVAWNGLVSYAKQKLAY